MKEKIRLLMEEAGCDEGQAELALEAVQYDVEKAIRNIGTLLRDFIVIKGKCTIPSLTLFGLIMIIVNSKTKRMVRLHTVISHNPAMYETDLALQWVAFEKNIFVQRLRDGAIQGLSQGIEQACETYFIRSDASQFYTALELDQNDTIIALCAGLIRDYLVKESLVSVDGSAPDKPSAGVNFIFSREDLNLAQFAHLEDVSAIQPSQPSPTTEPTIGPLYLNVSFALDAEGIFVEDLVEGAVVQSTIADDRDIAQYLGKLMGGRSGSDIIPFPASISRIRNMHKQIEIHTWLAPNIVGVGSYPQGTKVKVLYFVDEEWWQRIYPW